MFDLLSGHCYDSASGQPPRGLQFVLGSDANPAMVDTIVMANLVSIKLYGIVFFSILRINNYFI